MAYADQEMSGNKIVSLIVVALLHIVVGYAFISGLAYQAYEQVKEEITTIEITEDEPPPEEEPPPPEEIPDVQPPPVVVPPPPIQVPQQNRPQIQQQQEIPEQAPVVEVAAPPAPPPPAAPPPPPPPPSKAKGATPRGNTGRWGAQAQSSYPSRAIREEREGTVGFRLTVSAKGRATNCTVTSSSGHSDLDAAACKAMRRVARFRPALDDAGNPTTGSWNSRVRYELDNVR
ncbi:energy transducer TonB [Sphingorhabdus sp. Alg239-R122]|uniref:energy transducer TonB n=1 Tax=Sphingorhabdus sp. Alg239-R122 TaxID=2305989 RepID=UPI0013DB02B7|nr:energy transducer TonB [Sphingorhabdus sp. Alg239-R122]